MRDPRTVRRLFFGTLVSVFVAEVVAVVIVMFILDELPPLPPVSEAFLDGLMVAVLVVPVLYLFQFRPLHRLVAEETEARDQLDTLNRDLEAKVEERTARLQEVNRRLAAEVEERRRSEDQLQKSRDLMLRVLETSHSVVFIYDIEHGRCDYANAAMEKLLGLEPEAAYAMGAKFAKTVVDLESLSALLRPGARLADAEDGDIVDTMLWLADQDGERHLFDCRMLVSRRPDEMRPRSVLCMAAPRRWRGTDGQANSSKSGRRAGDVEGSSDGEADGSLPPASSRSSA